MLQEWKKTIDKKDNIQGWRINRPRNCTKSSLWWHVMIEQIRTNSYILPKSRTKEGYRNGSESVLNMHYIIIDKFRAW